jgi:Uma2 family endonuclease
LSAIWESARIAARSGRSYSLLPLNFPGLRKRLLPGQRVQVKPTRFRIPDVCITAADAPAEEIVTTAPELCIEILSPEDTMTRTLERIKEYFSMGVPTCWIIDPVGRGGWVARPGVLEEATDGVLRASGIEMPLGEVLESD